MGEKERPGKGKKEVKKKEQRLRFLAETGIVESAGKKGKESAASKNNKDIEEATAEVLEQVYGSGEPKAKDGNNMEEKKPEIAPSLDEKLSRFFARGEMEGAKAETGLPVLEEKISKPAVEPAAQENLMQEIPAAEKKAKKEQKPELPAYEKKEEEIIEKVASNTGASKIENSQGGVKPEGLREKYGEYLGVNLFKGGDPKSDWRYIAMPEKNAPDAKVKMYHGRGEKQEGFWSIDADELDKNFGTLLNEFKPVTKKAEPLVIKPGEINKPVTPMPEIPEGEMRLDRSQRAAKYVTDRVKNWNDELNAGTVEEGNKKFAEKLKQFWKEFSVHGIISTDRETGKTVLNSYADLDGKTALGLLKLAGFDISNLEFVEPGKYAEGRINLDTGNIHGYKENENGTAFIDHHSSESGKNSSTSKFTYQLLVDLGLLEQKEHLDKLCDFVTEEDNKEYQNSHFRENFKKSWGTVMGLYKKMSFEQLVDFFEKGGNPGTVLSKEQLEKYGLAKESEKRKKLIAVSLGKLKRMEKRGLVIGSNRYGKIAIDIGKKIELGYDAARAFGCGAYLIWNPETQSFFFSAVDAIEDDFSQGVKVRNTMWIKPQGDKKKLTVTLKEILEKITDGKLVPEGKLKEALDKEAKSKKKEDLSEMAEPKKHENEKFSEEEKIFIDEVYLPTVQKHLELVERHYSEANGYLKEDIPGYKKGEMNRFWNKLKEGMEQDGDIEKKNVGAVIEFLKETLNKK